MAKQTKVVVRRKKFQEVDVPITKGKIELIGEGIADIEGKTIKLDLTRQLKGKSVEVTVKVMNENADAGKGSKDPSGHAVAHPTKMKLMPYFIRRMIRKKISYVEDSLEIPSQESMLIVKPFLITRKRVSKAVRRALRNRAKNWLEDYISQMTDKEVFDEVLSNKLQKPLSLVLKKTYPLSLCEIRVLAIKRPLEKSEVPKKVARKKVEETKEEEGFIDQMAEIEAEKVKAAEEDMDKAQKKASKKEDEDKEEETKEVAEMKASKSDKSDSSPKVEADKEKKTTKKASKKKE